MPSIFKKINNYRKTKAGLVALPIAGYTLIAVVMTFPLMLIFRSFALAGGEDGAMSMWGMWWIKYALQDLGQSPLHTKYIFFPDGVSLIFHSIPKFMGVISIPIQDVLGLTVTYNLLVMLTFIGTGITTYWLVYHLLREPLPAFIAGAIFAFSPYRWGEISQLTLLSTVFIPVYIVLIIKARDTIENNDKRKWLHFISAGIVLGATAYDTEYYAIFLALFTVVFLAFYFPYRREKADVEKWLQLCSGIFLSAIIALLVFLPMLVNAVEEIAEKGDYAAQPANAAIRYSARLHSAFIPDATSAFFGGVARNILGIASTGETHFLGWTAVLIALYGLISFRKKREAWFWFLIGTIFLVLALGPKALDGYSFLPALMRNLPGPFALISYMPLVDSIRVPSRFIVMSSLATSVLAGYGISRFKVAVEGRKRHGLIIFGAALLLFSLLYLEYKPNLGFLSTRIPLVYEEISQDEATGSMVIIPLGWETGTVSLGDEHSWTMLFQRAHKMPMLGGMVARAPEAELAKVAETPVLAFLANPGEHELTAADREPATINRVLDEYQISYIVCQKTMPDTRSNDGSVIESFEVISAGDLQKIDEYVTGYLGMEKFEETNEVIAYRRK